MTETQIVSALDAELERLFDARIGAGTSSGSFVITDQEGRRLKVSQGAGDGSLFGTDEANSGGLLARETMRNNNSGMGWRYFEDYKHRWWKIALSGFSAAI